MHPTPLTRRVISAAAVIVMSTMVFAGCNDWLNAKKLTHDPSNPATAGLDNLFVSAQTSNTVDQTGQVPRTVCIWLQECVGLSDVFVALNSYLYSGDDYLQNWSNIYDGGGLIDLRKIETGALSIGDSIYAGEAYTLEALHMSMAADIWGDVPYTQASQPTVYPTPKPDSQHFVYDSLIHNLESAITFLNATGPTNFGSGSDLIYQNNTSLWIGLANTLRARLWLHMAKKLGTPAYDSVIGAIGNGQGIQMPSVCTGGFNLPSCDYLSDNFNTATGANLWSQFNTIYAGDVEAGAFMINLMVANSDPRLPIYWSPIDAQGDFAGGAPDFSGSPSAISNFSPTRVNNAFQQPLVTYAENELMLAEAYYQIGQYSLALLHLNNEQTEQGVPLSGSVTPGSNGLQQIMNEKYIALFQNLEIWNDWKRTGIPALPGAASIPRRLTYPLTEYSANPNIGGPGPTNNWNDPP
jgi:SusD/RagB-like outer membrane lipoprotein